MQIRVYSSHQAHQLLPTGLQDTASILEIYELVRVHPFGQSGYNIWVDQQVHCGLYDLHGYEVLSDSTKFSTLKYM